MDRAEDDVAFGLENRAWPLVAMRTAVPAALDAAGLGGFERRRGFRLSGGEQQRLALAGVMAPAPGVVVLDEPTANLDSNGAVALFDRLAAMKAGSTTTIVLVEHHADLAWPLADVVLALDGRGRQIDMGPAADVLARSRDRLAAEGIWLPGDATPGARRPSRPGPASPAPLLETRDLRFAYDPGRPVVRDVRLSVGAGERVALVGPNGSGKSTLLRLLAGLLRPAGGTVRLDGRDPVRLAGRRLAGEVGFVFQDPELGFLADTVAEDVTLGAAGVEGAAPTDGAVTDLMARLGLPLDRFGPRSPYRLSGGEQRRLSLAGALVRRPRLLLLDEPTFGQDRRGWELIVSLIAELVDAGTTVIAATHDRSFADRIADRRIEMADGWIVADEATGAARAPSAAGTAG